MNLDIYISRSKGKSKQKLSQYSVPYKKGMTVLDVILYVARDVDPTLAFRYECRQAICGTCGVMYNGKPVLSCGTQIDEKQTKHVIAPLANFPVEKDLIVDLKAVLKRYAEVKPYLDKIHETILTKRAANASKLFRKCIECGCCIAGSPTVAKDKAVLDPMALVKIARYVTDPRDGLPRKAMAQKGGVEKYSEQEGKHLSEICPRGIPIDQAIELLK